MIDKRYPPWMADAIVRNTPTDDEVDEEWSRVTDDRESRGVTAITPRNYMWQVFVSLAEFVRQEPLESEMRHGMVDAPRAVPGVTDVTEGDREVWDVEGTPSGRALVEAAATVVDALAARAHASLGF